MHKIDGAQVKQLKNILLSDEKFFWICYIVRDRNLAFGSGIAPGLQPGRIYFNHQHLQQFRAEIE